MQRQPALLGEWGAPWRTRCPKWRRKTPPRSTAGWREVSGMAPLTRAGWGMWTDHHHHHHHTTPYPTTPQAAAAVRRTPKAPTGRHSRPPPTGRSPGGGGGGGGLPPPSKLRSGRRGVEGSHFLSPHHTIQPPQHALSVQIFMCMCAMALRLGLVFRLESPLSGHSLTAGRRGGPTLSTGLDSTAILA